MDLADAHENLERIEKARSESVAALAGLRADIVAGRSLDLAPFDTIASLQTLHRTAAAALGLDAEATTAQIAQALDELTSREATRASLARARRLEGPADPAAPTRSPSPDRPSRRALPAMTSWARPR
jgi:hypothetical protein